VQLSRGGLPVLPLSLRSAERSEGRSKACIRCGLPHSRHGAAIYPQCGFAPRRSVSGCSVPLERGEPREHSVIELRLLRLL
jgi:hypothetical protein